MVVIKPIGIHEETKSILDQLKEHPRESYDGVIRRLIEHWKKSVRDEPDQVELEENKRSFV